MTGRGLFPDDVAVVDKAREPKSGCVVVACLNGDFTLKNYLRRRGRVILKAKNPAFPDIEVPEEADFQVWGVVTRSSRGLSHTCIFANHCRRRVAGRMGYAGSPFSSYCVLSIA